MSVQQLFGPVPATMKALTSHSHVHMLHLMYTIRKHCLVHTHTHTHTHTHEGARYTHTYTHTYMYLRRTHFNFSFQILLHLVASDLQLSPCHSIPQVSRDRGVILDRWILGSEGTLVLYARAFIIVCCEIRRESISVL